MSHKVLFLGPSGQSIGYGTDPACKRSDRAFAEKRHSRRSGIRSDRSVPDFFASSASLSSKGSAKRSASFASRVKGSLHGEAAERLDPGDSVHRPPKGATHQRCDRRSAVGLFAEKESWLRATPSAACVSSLQAVTTATLRKSSRKFIEFWFRASVSVTT